MHHNNISTAMKRCLAWPSHRAGSAGHAPGRDQIIIERISADRLGLLVGHGVFDRVLYQERPERFEYRLTRKGVDLWPVMQHRMEEFRTSPRWGEWQRRNHEVVAYAQELLRRVGLGDKLRSRPYQLSIGELHQRQ